MNNRSTVPAAQQGMSLVEMMIAMTISLIVIGAVSGVYLSSSRNYTQDEMLSRMQENARYAMHILSGDLSMAGYWGPLMSGQEIKTSTRSCPELDGGGNLEDFCTGFFKNSSLSIDTDCGTGTRYASPPSGRWQWAYSLEDPIETSLDETDFSCIDAFEAGSDILVVKRVEGQKLASTRDDSDDNGYVFLRTDGTDAMLFTYDKNLDDSEGAGVSDWRYRANVYYIREHFLESGDGIPTLVRGTLSRVDSSSTPTMGIEPGGIAQGIESFRVMFGIDQDGDATPNIYTSNPTLAQLNNVTSARIYVLARSAAEDPSYENNKTYELGDVTVNAGGDGFYRRVFATTIALRNQRNRIQTTGN